MQFAYYFGLSNSRKCPLPSMSSAFGSFDPPAYAFRSSAKVYAWAVQAEFFAMSNDLCYLKCQRDSEDISLKRVITAVAGARMRDKIEHGISRDGRQGDEDDRRSGVELALPAACDHVA